MISLAVSKDTLKEYAVPTTMESSASRIGIHTPFDMIPR